MAMISICLVGAFGDETSQVGGQEVKTRNLYKILLSRYGVDNIVCVDTRSWKSHPLKVFNLLKRGVKQSNVIIMLPAHNGVKIFTPLLLRLVRNSGKKLFYDVIGGWLPQMLLSNVKLKEKLRIFDGIWVETESMRTSLVKEGLDNVFVIPNFKFINALDRESGFEQNKRPLKVCTFSRVIKEKGIEDAIEVVEKLNQNGIDCSLDVYGPIGDCYRDEFLEIMKKSPKYISYKGCIPPEDSISVLNGYYALLFPTRYKTEGIPGTIIDAYGAGLPVVAADWDSCDDIVINNVTGIKFELGNNDSMYSALKYCIENSEWWNSLRKNCLKEYEKYDPLRVAEQIYSQIEGV